MTVSVFDLLKPGVGPSSSHTMGPTTAAVRFIGLLRASGLLARVTRVEVRPGKIDFGVGVYRDDAGDAPVFASVKAAEARLVETQRTGAHLGPEGDLGFLDLITPVVFGDETAGADVIAVQTPGGNGRPAARCGTGQRRTARHPGLAGRAELADPLPDLRRRGPGDREPPPV